MMTFRNWALSVFSLILLPMTCTAAVMNVGTSQQLQSALSTAASNNENDVILVSSGAYTISSTLVYDSTEEKSLSVEADGGGAIFEVSTIQGLNFYSKANSTNATIALKGITIRGGFQNDQLSAGGGAFIRTQQGNLTVENCVFTNNRASKMFEEINAGGAYLRVENTGEILLKNNSFVGNSATGSGGGAMVFGPTGGKVTLINNIFGNNSASVGGGGIYVKVYSGQLNIINNTLTGNFTGNGFGGGGIYAYLNGDDSVANIYNNIAWTNTDSSLQGPDMYFADDPDANGVGAVINLKYNDYKAVEVYDGDHTFVGSNIDVNPLFGPGFKLQAGSPCIDKGTNYPGMNADFVGLPRPLDGNGDFVARCDLGAYEFAAPPIWVTQSDVSVALGNAVNLGVSATNANGTAPTLSAAAKPANATFTDNGNGSGIFSWTPSFVSEIGVSTVKLVASDGLFAVTNIFQVTVSSFAVTSPVAGTSVLAGASVPVAWTGSQALGAVNVSLWKGTNIVRTLTNGFTYAGTSGSWLAPLARPLTRGTNYWIRVTDAYLPTDRADSAGFTVESTGLPWLSLLQ